MTDDLVSRAEILPLLGVVRRSGTDILAFCPSHSDGQKHGGKAGHSLVLHESGVLQCMAGCKFGDVLAALRANAGDRPRVNGSKASPVARETLGELVIAYDYRDPHTGALVAVKGRFEKPSADGGKPDKSFRWRMPEGDYQHGIKDGGLSVATMPLWGAEALTDGRVWVAEGESATLAIRARGELAVCGAWGASQRDFGTAFEVLRGRDVILWPDNDVSGREYMAEVRRHLRGIARSVVVVSAPVPPKGDAVEYFAQGGTVEALLADVLPRDAVELVARDGLRVRCVTEAGEVAFDVLELSEERRDLNCELTVTWRNPAAEIPYSQRINLLSASACEGLTRILGKHFREMSGVNWTALISRLLAHVRTALRDMDISELEQPDPDARPADFVLRGYVVEGGGTILFGAPKRGKSQAALAMALTIDAGLSGIFTAPRPRSVLYVNLERSRGSMQARLARVNAAMGLDMRRPLRFIHARGSGLAAIMPRVAKAIHAHGVEVLVLDSISRGGFGDLNSNAVANAAIDALNSLGVSWIAIGHSPRPNPQDSSGPHLYGSVHQDAGADVLVALQSKPAPGNRLMVTLTVTDANDFAQPEPLDMVYEFDDEGIVAIRRAVAEERVDMEDTKILTVRQQILASIRDDGPGTSGAIALRLGKKQPHVSRDLGVLARDGSVARDKDGIWALTDTFYHEPYHGNTSGNLPITTLPDQPPPFRGGDGNGMAGKDLDRNEGECFECKRTGIVVAGFHPSSTIETERPLCAACADDLLASTEGRK